MNIRNAESAYLVGQARFKKSMGQFMQSWYAPYMDQQVLGMWETLPVEVKDRLRQAKPTEFAEFERRVESIRQGTGS